MNRTIPQWSNVRRLTCKFPDRRENNNSFSFDGEISLSREPIPMEFLFATTPRRVKFGVQNSSGTSKLCVTISDKLKFLRLANIN